MNIGSILSQGVGYLGGPFAAFSMGLSLWDSFQSGRSSSQLAESQISNINEGLRDLTKAKKNLAAEVKSREEIVGKKLDVATKDLGIKVSDSASEITKKYDVKTGFATHKELEGMKEDTMKRLNVGASVSQSNLLDLYGEGMKNISDYFATETSKISSQQKELMRMRELAKQQRDAWYPGKNIFG